MINASSTIPANPAPPADAAGLGGLRVGSLIAGKYRLERVIGSGGMGLVVSAVHVALGQRVAIKILRIEVEHERDEAIVRFMREARAAARIQSDHVARVVDIAALADGTPYMVMEYLDGCDLRDLVIERGPLPIQEATDYMLQACEALAEAHAAGIVHRDLKPGNLFLAKRANASRILKVLDFGISKVTPYGADPKAGITSTKSLMGSPLYMAPEQMRSSRDVDARADVWALGTILYELLAGAPAFVGSTIPEVCVHVMSGAPRPLELFRKNVPPQLQAIVLKCLSKNRADRYASVAELARELQRFAGPHAQIHADRASATMKSALARRVESVRPDDGVPLTRDGAPVVSPPPPPRMPSGPELAPLAAAAPIAPAPEAKPRDVAPRDANEPPRARKRAIAIALGGAFGLTLALAGTAIVAHRSSDARVASAAPQVEATSAPAPAEALPAPPATGTSDIATVPFDQLPQAAHREAPKPPTTAIASPPPVPSSPVARASRAAAPAVAEPHAPSPSPAPPAPAAPAAPTAHADDWKWGDRN